MLGRPDKETLLAAIAKFLEEQVKPGLQDPGLAYRTIVAASVLKSVALECQGEAARHERERSRLEELLGPSELGLRDLRRQLCDRIRARPAPPRTRELLMATLKDELAITNPRFDTRDEIES